MDPWKLFSELCRLVVEEQNVYLEVFIFDGRIKMELYPFITFEEDECEND